MLRGAIVGWVRVDSKSRGRVGGGVGVKDLSGLNVRIFEFYDLSGFITSILQRRCHRLTLRGRENRWSYHATPRPPLSREPPG